MFRLAAALPVALFFSLADSSRAADSDVTELSAALQLPEVFAVMTEEGLGYGRELEADMFPGSGGARWNEAVAGIYETGRMVDGFSEAFEAALDTSGGNVSSMLEFFSSDLGRRVVALEISARRALLDEAVDEASRAKLDEMRETGDPRLELIEEFVSVNDLVDANVTGGLNANYAFYLGLADAGALPSAMSEDEIIGEIWGQEADIRDETEIWILSYLAMAYAPLSDEEIGEYIDFSETEAGRDLNRALFAGYDTVFEDVSRQLGRAAGAILAGQDL
ncbi:DUF2059 domain-containing protein [Defluviimonas sp. WL0050]|uniref:DUF2059 domain-containing protein n=1 Tax=Albidovulum litorale TaxID=2984134 RepID=A0ABT2ZQM9_9RHOB|nr:DUF2059 domain-containing protein [Defluviimonas sp. WL0050]MCV2873265.1 DUF2059 domain-containing protein [Defluviimonas sp. WL0050]